MKSVRQDSVIYNCVLLRLICICAKVMHMVLSYMHRSSIIVSFLFSLRSWHLVGLFHSDWLLYRCARLSHLATHIRLSPLKVDFYMGARATSLYSI